MVTSQKFREVMSNFATGITVVTTRGSDGNVYGLTVNSFTSVSLDPLHVLVCLDNHLSCMQHFQDSQRFAVSILSGDQEGLSRLFAKKDSERAESLYFDGPAGLPLLKDALAYLECETVATYPGGDHQIFLGKVLSGEVRDDQTHPILYFRGRYHKVHPM
jgi:3-hydroxy-9,10-secoandrosta-1,3,5(10)-triene-9,17-dione monooxygenase reductase component